MNEVFAGGHGQVRALGEDIYTHFVWHTATSKNYTTAMPNFSWFGTNNYNFIVEATMVGIDDLLLRSSKSYALAAVKDDGGPCRVRTGDLSIMSRQLYARPVIEVVMPVMRQPRVPTEQDGKRLIQPVMLNIIADAQA